MDLTRVVFVLPFLVACGGSADSGPSSGAGGAGGKGAGGSKSSSGGTGAGGSSKGAGGEGGHVPPPIDAGVGVWVDITPRACRST
jgi:hypothetical protein